MTTLLERDVAAALAAADPEPGLAEVALLLGAAALIGGAILGTAWALAWARWWRWV